MVKTGFGKPRVSRGATEKGDTSLRVATVPFRELALRAPYRAGPRATDGTWPSGLNRPPQKRV